MQKFCMSQMTTETIVFEPQTSPQRLSSAMFASEEFVNGEFRESRKVDLLIAAVSSAAPSPTAL